MSNLLQTFEKKQIEKLTGKKRIPTFRTGDTLKVTLRITEGDKSRLQAFEGMCIARKNNSVNSNFTVRKLSHGEGVERVFPLFGPMIEKIEVVRKGDVRRSKLYYLRKLTGKSARIADKDRGEELDQYEYSIEEDKIAQETETQEQKQSQNNTDLASPNSIAKEKDKTSDDDSKHENNIEKTSSDAVKNKTEPKSDEQKP